MKRMIYTRELKDIEEITGMKCEKLWKFINLDDWDYALIVSGRITKKDMAEDSILSDEGYGLLRGCCSNEWQYIEPINMTVGMAYHS